jgi:putative glycosyltransferase
MKLSVVTTLYQSALYLPEFHKRIVDAAADISSDFEVIYVNDGSPDDSLAISINIAQLDPRVVVVDLARNFGQHKAIMTGLKYARGELVFLIDSDLEEAPELISDFSACMTRIECDVVFGVQKRRKGAAFERMSGAAFYWFFKRVSGLDLPDNQVTARLMKRPYVRALIAHKDREIFLAGLWHITGFRQVPIVVHKASKGDTTYNFRRKLSILVNSITSFSTKPLIAIFYIGATISALSALYIVYLVGTWFLYSVPVTGYTSLIVSIWFLGGLTIFFLGVIGIYLSKIFAETKDRPYTVIRAIYRGTVRESV